MAKLKILFFCTLANVYACEIFLSASFAKGSHPKVNFLAFFSFFFCLFLYLLCYVMLFSIIPTLNKIKPNEKSLSNLYQYKSEDL